MRRKRSLHFSLSSETKQRESPNHFKIWRICIILSYFKAVCVCSVRWNCSSGPWLHITLKWTFLDRKNVLDFVRDGFNSLLLISCTYIPALYYLIRPNHMTAFHRKFILPRSAKKQTKNATLAPCSLIISMHPSSVHLCERFYLMIHYESLEYHMVRPD